mgnify:CR=1 FL=1
MMGDGFTEEPLIDRTESLDEVGSVSAHPPTRQAIRALPRGRSANLTSARHAPILPPGAKWQTFGLYMVEPTTGGAGQQWCRACRPETRLALR